MFGENVYLVIIGLHDEKKMNIAQYLKWPEPIY